MESVLGRPFLVLKHVFPHGSFRLPFDVVGKCLGGVVNKDVGVLRVRPAVFGRDYYGGAR